MLTSRIVWLLTGVTWAALSLMEFAHPDYWDPVSVLDWASIWLFSAALLLLVPAVLLIGRLAPGTSVTAVARIVASGAVVAGVANGLEDGLGVSSMGMLYVAGILVAGLGLLPLAVALRRSGSVRLGWLTAALFLGILTFPLGGGLIVLVAFTCLATAPGWFTQPSRIPVPVC
jgi:hypothetical protein